MGQQKGNATRGTPHESHQGEQRGDDREDVQEERDVDDRFSIQSYYGTTDKDKTDNRKWFTDVYPKLFFSMPKEEELSGNAHTIEMSLKLLGVTLRSEDDVNNFFDNVKRGAMVKEKEKWVKKTCSKGVHPDMFNRRVANDKMRLECQHRCAALTTALGALKEWDDLALDEAKRTEIDEGRSKSWSSC